MNLLTLIFGYFFSISFLLFGFLISFASPLSGFLIIAGSLLIFPKLTERIKKFFWFKTGRYLPRFSLGITCFVLIFSSILVFSSPNSSQKSEVNGVKSANLSANSGQKSSSSNSNFSSNSSSSTGLPSGQIVWNSEKIENLAVSSEIFSQNLAKCVLFTKNLKIRDKI